MLYTWKTGFGRSDANSLLGTENSRVTNVTELPGSIAEERLMSSHEELLSQARRQYLSETVTASPSPEKDSA